MSDPTVSGPRPEEEEVGKKRTLGIIMLIVTLVALGYATVLFLGGKALQNAPFAAQVLKVRRGLEGLSNAEPPQSLGNLPPLAGRGPLNPTAAPSPITLRSSPSPSPSQSPRVIPPAPDDPSVITFTIEFENTTGVRLTGVKITDKIPAGTAFLTGTASPAASFDGSQLVWDIGTVDPGATGKVSFRVTTRLKGKVTNRATLTSNEAPAAQIESSATVQ